MLWHTLRGMSIGKRIRDARDHAGLKQHELADACKVRHLAISQWERDRTVPRADQLAAIADRCAVDPGWLLSGDGDMAVPQNEVA